MNQVRPLGLIFILFNLKDISKFGFYHTGVGQILAMVMIFGFWMVWVNKVLPRHVAASTGDRVSI